MNLMETIVKYHQYYEGGQDSKAVPSNGASTATIARRWARSNARNGVICCFIASSIRGFDAYDFCTVCQSHSGFHADYVTWYLDMSITGCWNDTR